MTRIEGHGPAAGPSWLGAVVRAFHPARWGLCGVGLAASVLLWTLAQAIFEQAAPRPQAWWQDPLAELRRLSAELFEQSSGTAVFRCLFLAATLSAVWSFVGAWIARSELLRQRATRAADQTGGLTPTTATALVRSKASSLVMLLPMIIILVGILLLPGWIAGLVNRFLGMGIGALLVVLLLPVVLVSSLVAVVILVGCISYCLMPAAIAAEGRDHFDAISRGYSYLHQRPFRFGGWCGLALAISGLPLLGGFLLLRQEASLLGPAGTSAVEAAGAALSLSLFWTLQSLVYLKMRRAVDDTLENEIWLSPCDRKSPGANPEPSAGPTDTPENGPPETETALEPVRPQQTEVSFQDTLKSRSMDLQPARLLALLIGAVWTGLVVAGGALATWELAAGPGQRMTAEYLREAVWALAEQRPAALFGIGAGVVLLGALGLGRWVKLAARMGAVSAVFGGSIGLKTVWPFASRTRGLGIGSVLLATAGIELLLVAGFLAPLAFQGTATWEEVAVLSGLGMGMLGLGSLGLGAVAVEGQRREVTRPSTAGIYLDNGLETGASAAANLVLVPLRSVTMLALVWLAWLLACESLSWLGGEKVQWVRWGLASTLVPESEEALYRAASALAGIWFLFLFGLLLMYPLSCALTWGITCYLRARQQTEGIPPGQLELSAEERQGWSSGRQNGKTFLEDLQKKGQDGGRSRRRKGQQEQEAAKGSEAGAVAKAEDRPASAAPLMKIRCLKCRALNDEAAKFCNQCGAAI